MSRYSAGIGAPQVRLDKELHGIAKRLQNAYRASGGTVTFKVVIENSAGETIELMEKLSAPNPPSIAA